MYKILTPTPEPLGKAREEKLDLATREIMNELGIADLPQGP